MLISVIGFDPSLNNWGIARGKYNTASGEITIASLEVIKPVAPSRKIMRVNSSDLSRAAQLAQGVIQEASYNAQIFVEVPVGSQSARSMASYGVCIGILGYLRAMGTPFYEVTPTEVKQVASGKSSATKKEMIDWASGKHPDAPWPMKMSKGTNSIVTGTAEHMADAVAAIYAGVASPTFQQNVALLNATKR